MPDNDRLLSVRDLKTWFDTTDQTVRAVDGVSFDINKGETFALLGESGCGKSMTSLSLMRLVPEPAGRIVSGSITLAEEELLELPEVAMRNVRGNRISMIFQEPMTSLNPVLTIGLQIQETVMRHSKMKSKAAYERVLELLYAVGIPDPKRRYSEYPHQLSGGMKQRVMIAIALAGEPELLIADEPTTALDVTIQAQVLSLIKDIQKDTGMAIFLITHDLGVVSEMADRVAVMYAGQIVEQSDREAFFSRPQHPYSQKLFASLPTMAKRGQTLEVIEGAVPSLAKQFDGCRFADRCDFATTYCHENTVHWLDQGDGNGVRCHLQDPRLSEHFSQNNQQVKPKSPEPAVQRAIEGGDHAFLEVQDMKVHFPVTKGLFKRHVGAVKAVDGIDLNIPKGKTLALVGESGCGKTTAGKGILQLIRPTEGSVRLQQSELTKLKGKLLRRKRGEIQIIFQDPFSSMNPRMMVGPIIEEGMIAQRVGGDRAQRQARIDELLDQVGLSADAKHRYPHEFSGGQRQRICIARALAVEPKLIVCDEPTSALDVSVQAQILNLLKKLQNELGLSYLFITHNISVVEFLAHEVAVMYLGRIVEQGLVQEVIQNPQHPYTKALLSAVPHIHRDADHSVIQLRGEMPSPMMPPIGCHFNPRCAHAVQACRNKYPQPVKFSETHSARCFLYK